MAAAAGSRVASFDRLASLPESLADQELDGAAAVEVASDAWKKTLDAVAPAVVVLKVTQTRAFDTEAAGSSYATGFVVDKARGLILTNRHVVTPGPVVAEAIFLNREEVPVQPLYYDPVHDFGFMRFNPSRLQFMTAAEIPLAPHAAAVGLDIRVVGNDSGEKISILSGTLARLDRDAPHYSRRGFNDFNTFYLQAASGTKGGSSGSPVVNIRGQAVGLNAGGKNKAASAYYLPLHRIVRALRLLQAGHRADGTWSQPHIPRGDFQATFGFKGYDEVRRLGLRTETEAEVRASKQQQEADGPLREVPGSTGMLVVESVVPGGPADGQLEPGDVLVKLNGQIVTEFLTMEDLLDSSVGGTVHVEVERGGQPLAADIRVQDLHAVTPKRLLDLGGGAVNELSYQQARNNRAAVGQTYVAEPGYLLGKAGVPKHAIITALGGTPTPNMAAFIEALKTLRQGQRVPVQFFTFGERHRRKSSLLTVNWRWYGPPLVWTRNNAAGIWDCRVELPHSMIGSPLAAAAVAGPVAGLPAPASGGKAAGGSASKRPPLHPNSAAGGGARAAAGAGGGVAGVSGSTGGIPRRRSVQAIPQHEDIEKQQPGVTAQPDDARLLNSPVFDASAAAAGGVAAAATVAAAAAEGDAANLWRSLLEEELRCGLALVDVEIPLVALADGVHSRSFSGCGVIVHQSDTLGLVLVDRNTVTVGPGDVMLSFGAFPAEVPARVRFLHPLHNFTIVSYDPRQLSEEARRLIRPLRLAPQPPLRRGDSVELVCLSKSLRILHRTSCVTNPAMNAFIHKAEVPRFRAVHEEVIKLDQDFGLAYSGVLCDRSGGVRALWGSYSEQISKEEQEWTAGLPAAAFAPWVEKIVAEHARQQSIAAAAVAPLQQATAAPAGAEPAAAAGQGAGPPSSGSSDAGSDGSGSSGGTNGSGGGAADQEFEPVPLPPPQVVTLDAELEPLLLSKAAQFGLPTEWVSRLVRLDPERRQVLRVHSCVAGSHAQQVLNDADMVLAINGAPVSSYNDVERIIAEVAAAHAAGTAGTAGEDDGGQAGRAGSPPSKRPRTQDGSGSGSGGGGGDGAEPAAATPAAAANGGGSEAGSGSEAEEAAAGAGLPEVQLTIFRDGSVEQVAVRLGREDGLGTDRLVHWCGAQLQYPHRGVRELGFLPDRHGVYISRWHHGSPAHRYGLYALHWVSEVNGQPTPDLDAFIEVVRRLPDGADARVRLVHNESSKSKVLTLKTDHRYWPTWELRLDSHTGEWTRHAISSAT